MQATQRNERGIVAATGLLGFEPVFATSYICHACGYCKTWVDAKEDRDRIAKSVR